MTDNIGRGFNFPFNLNERGQLALTRGHTEIVQSIRMILSTYPGERVMRPSYGCRIHDLVFEPCNKLTCLIAERYVTEALNAWEPRITLESVVAVPNYESGMGHLVITINYRLKDNQEQQSLIYPFYLTPAETE